MCCHQNKPGTRWCSYSANANETHLSSDSGNPSCCRLCGLVKHVTYCKKISSRRRMKNYTLRRRLSMEDLWLIFTSKGSHVHCVGLVNGDKIVLCKMRLTSLHDSYGSWHLYNCRFLFGLTTFLSLHSCLWRALRIVLLGENRAVRSCYGKF